jgi:hypothetical protein
LLRVRSLLGSILILLLGLAPFALAQDDCPALVKQAYDTIEAACQDTGRNQACYGNVLMQATPHEGVSNFSFSKAGDLANVADVQTLQLSSMSLTNNEWGIGLMKVQANIPDTLPGQSVVFVLFGDVQIGNEGDTSVVNQPRIRTMSSHHWLPDRAPQPTDGWKTDHGFASNWKTTIWIQAGYPPIY